MPDHIDKIKQFPDGCWWIRWVDKYHVFHKRTSSPAVEVVISPLDASRISQANLKTIISENPKTVRIPLSTGMIPRLKLGTVFQDGVPICDLPLESTVFTLDTEKHPPAICKISDSLNPVPDNWKSNSPYRVMNLWEYPLIGFLESKCVVAKAETQTVILPCHEIFRTLYAPYQKIALAFTSGPWRISQVSEEGTWSQVVNPKFTGPIDPQTWQVVMRKDIPDRFAEVLANLTSHPLGIAAANEIYAHSLGSGNAGFLHAAIPFDSKQLRIEARYLELRKKPAKYLVMEITAIEWPHPSVRILKGRDNSNQLGKVRTPVEKPKPFAGMNRPVDVEPDRPVPVDSNEDPGNDAGVVNFICDGPKWLSPPHIQTLEKEESFTYLGLRTVNKEESVVDVSPGRGVPGCYLGRAAYSEKERRDPSNRFTEVEQMLNSLLAKKKINAWNVVASETAPAFSGKLPVWRFPAKLSNNKCAEFQPWSFLDKKREYRRRALVCSIRYQGNVVYWLEVEVGAQGGIKSLLFISGVDNTYSLINKLLQICTKSRGVWPEDKDLRKESGADKLCTLRHVYYRTKDHDGETNVGILNEERALSSIAAMADANHKSRSA